MSGYFITLEGIDGCGKTTQRRLSAGWLREQGHEVVETFEPGDTVLGREIRALLLGGAHVPAAETELLLFLADRTQHVREVILPALERGAVVLCDRYTDSTRAYQLAGRALDASVLEAMLTIAELGTVPQLTLWFDLPVAAAFERMRSRVAGGEAASRFDAEHQAFHERVRQGFSAIHAAQPQRVQRVDASGDAQSIQQQVRALLGRYLA
ncbi:MAG: dTMP kinase [Zetaproteobacteria bacterium CG06_land_8_20_14_3_00_59_53]|nr:MAG: dTMP kinase [Zetaproteobacteria bacterium CG2_30_59_37]PIO90591.1 MAG: dTMP kinase [Zetaproteobacteria bacterium CG23_combo_of_CG06-09_8_20_14_all_59_86]PIQ66143.1 MAG: dTMP kinase [Zetaproteobacteria bacterium CG11_big_fil_rev_8_21_14_0_20_59_439]PIU71538.1 MAG: dTMP kinase [Zetaproteobacteria bacterium CG06_land_8_20_14_3_00_59_53]PIU97798.1 MAG: dTMP kinase [Zetaproteobacteria bacterium CG03_land_8_20_14_0_80_59_51]PIY47364.1 MAG: dTMP kinase [Zetaproteobacteria bacterium CG_4_10_14